MIKKLIMAIGYNDFWYFPYSLIIDYWLSNNR